MKNKTISLGIVFLLVAGGLLIFLDVGTQNVQATDVSGTVFDGSGGPWNIAGSPYIVIGSILVPAGETLTIEPGVEVRFDGFFSIVVEGNLSAVGTENQMINITSNSLTPAARDWESITIQTLGHAEISYCNVSYGEQAILLFEGSNNVTNNNITNNEWAINCYSGGNNISNNTLSNNTWGIGLLWSICNNLTENTMINDGIYLYGDQLEQWNSHYIDTSNTANGKPVYYVTNQTGGTVPMDAGQIILANCTGMQIEDHEISNTTAAIQLGFCSFDNIIAHNDVANNTQGIVLDQSNNNNISNNTACFNRNGIVIRYSDQNIITDNNCSDGVGVGTWGSGIFLSDGTGNSVYNNTCVNNFRAGIELSFNADGNYIFENNCSYNRYGIMCFYASHNEWYNNTCNNNTAWGLYLNGDSINNTFKENSFISNDEYGMELRDGNTNTILNNEINWNKIYGVYITSAANNNTVIYNDINNNTDYGIILETPDNIIHHNNIAYNNGSTDIYDPTKIQGFDDSINFWNTSDQGNWWADWTTPDIAAPFGIVDNPNLLDGGGMDFFPLTSPVDPTPPDITNLQPPDGTMTIVNTTLIAANYTDDSGINTSSVVLKINDVDMTSSATVTPDGVSYTPAAGFADGIHEVYLEVMNIYDNPANATWNFTIDTKAPQLTNIQPSDGSVTNDDTISISANFTDPSGIDMGSIALLVDGIDVTSSATVTADGISYTPSVPWTEGTHTYELYVNDTLSNSVGIFKDFTVDTIPPEAITDLVASDPTTDSITLTWTAPGDDGDVGTAIEYEVRYSFSGAITDGNWNSASRYIQSWTPLATGETETHIITGLSQDTQYWFAIRALDEVPNTAGVSNSPDETTLIVQTAPSAPQNLQLTWGDSYVDLTWETPSSDGNSVVTNYRIYRGISSGSQPFLIEIGDVRTYNDTPVTNGVTYYYKVSAVNSIGESSQTPYKSATPATLPSAPLNLQAAAGVGYVEITWDAPSDDGGLYISNYRIYRSNASGEETYLTQIGNVLLYNDTTVEIGETYYYVVAAKNALGEGPQSGEASGIPTAPPNVEPQSAITSLTAGQELEGTVTITGTASDTDGTVEMVQIRIGTSGNWITVTGTDTWSYELDTTKLSNGEHTIYIRSYDGEDYSPSESITIEVSNPKEDKTIMEEAWFLPLIIAIIVVIIVVLLLVTRKREPVIPEEEEIAGEEAPGEEEPLEDEVASEEPLEDETGSEESLEDEEASEEPLEEEVGSEEPLEEEAAEPSLEETGEDIKDNEDIA